MRGELRLGAVGKLRYSSACPPGPPVVGWNSTCEKGGRRGASYPRWSNKSYGKSADGWVAWPPARLFHGVPRLYGVVPKHPPLGHRHRRARWLPAVGRQRDPLGMSGRHVVLEANNLLLLIVHQPPLAASLGGTVLVAGAFFEHRYNLRTETPPPKTLNVSCCSHSSVWCPLRRPWTTSSARPCRKRQFGWGAQWIGSQPLKPNSSDGK